MNLRSGDRVIINGGEPFLHTQIDEILLGLKHYSCEVLIYTNGRLLKSKDFSQLNSNYRFVIPIHGPEAVHDSITGIRGSFRETIDGLHNLVNHSACLADVKLIINNYLTTADPTCQNTLRIFDEEIQIIHAVHLTKMADTILSRRNGCKSVSNEDAAHFMKICFDYFSKHGIRLKIFDTCVKELPDLPNSVIKQYDQEIIVYFKDDTHFRMMDLSRQQYDCMNSCHLIKKCMSAVDEYKALEFFAGKFTEGLE